MIQLYILLSLTIGFGIVTFSIPKIILISKVKKLFVVHNEHSTAQNTSHTLGGIGIYAGFVISIFISLNNFNTQFIYCLLPASFMMFLTGLKDDMIGLSARRKLLYQLLTAIYLIFMGGIKINSFDGIMGIFELDVTSSSLITLFAIVGIVNAYNLIDGIDGLAAGLGILISVAFGSLFVVAGEIVYAVVSFSLTGCLLAFFFFNVFGRDNKIFMGDTGSLTVGVIFAFLMIRYVELPAGSHHIIGSPAIALAILIVPVIDTLRVMSIRMYQKRSPFSPDMNHIHHQLLRLTSGNHLHASLVLIVSNLAFVVFAISFVEILGNNLLFFLLLAAGFTAAYVPVIANKMIDSKQSVQEPVKVIQLSHRPIRPESKFADR